jgi:predicted small metal-binding protein
MMPNRDDQQDPLSTKQTPGPEGTNPFDQGRHGVTGGTGRVNPSAPTVGTEAGTGQGESLSFRCAEIHPSCNWEARGRNEEDLRPQIEQHAREHHNLGQIGEETWSKIRNLIQRRAA